MPPMTPTEWTTLVVALIVLAVLLWALPSCGDETCTVAHTRHNVAHRAAEIERRHATFHGPTQLGSATSAGSSSPPTPSTTAS